MTKGGSRRRRKTTAKTTEPPPRPIQARQAHGGALNAGGTPGNRGGSGRPRNEFRDALRSMASDSAFLGQLAAILQDNGHPRFIDAAKLVIERGYGRVMGEDCIPREDVQRRLQASIEAIRATAPVDLASEILDRMRAAWT